MLEFKLISACLILLVGLAGGFTPWLFTTRKNAERLFSYGNAFAGGVFLSVGLIHMLGEAAEQFNQLWPNLDYPLVYAIATASFLMLLLIERVSIKNNGFDEVRLTPIELTQTVDQKPNSFANTYIYPAILLVTLSVHSVLTGIALGIQSGISDVTILLIAILAHKGTAGIALGVSLQRSSFSKKTKALLVVVFTVMTPIGILLGIAFSEIFQLRQREVVEAIFNALAAGTFLYIAALDIFAEEFIRPQQRWQKFILTCSGFAIMAIVAIWT